MNKELMCSVMYDMFKDGNLPDLDMEDFIVMWEALAEKWNIKDSIWIRNWDFFVNEINVRTSEDENWFKFIFNKYLVDDTT